MMMAMIVKILMLMAIYHDCADNDDDIDQPPQLQVFDSNKDGKLQLSEMAK